MSLREEIQYLKQQSEQAPERTNDAQLTFYKKGFFFLLGAISALLEEKK